MGQGGLTVRHPLALLGLCALGGGVYGLATSSIPAPHDVTVFWVGNFCAPWLVLPFFAGWLQSQRSVRWAVFAGAVTDVACVFGFYATFLTLDPSKLGLPPASSGMRVATTSLSQWFDFIGPWLVIALAAGAIYGALGRWWGRSRSIVAGASVGLPFIAEPWLWPVYQGFYRGPLVVWVAEFVVGAVVLSWVTTAWRRSLSRSPQPAN